MIIVKENTTNMASFILALFGCHFQIVKFKN